MYKVFCANQQNSLTSVDLQIKKNPQFKKNLDVCHRSKRKVSFRTRIEEIDGINHKFQMWDTTGQERFDSISKGELPGTVERDSCHAIIHNIRSIYSGYQCDFIRLQSLRPQHLWSHSQVEIGYRRKHLPEIGSVLCHRNRDRWTSGETKFKFTFKYYLKRFWSQGTTQVDPAEAKQFAASKGFSFVDISSNDLSIPVATDTLFAEIARLACIQKSQ